MGSGFNLKDVTGVEDKGSHFLVSHKKTGKFQVAKQGLDKQSLDSIQKLCVGGSVKMADGGDVPFVATPTPKPDPFGNPDWSKNPPGQYDSILSPHASVGEPTKFNDFLQQWQKPGGNSPLGGTATGTPGVPTATPDAPVATNTTPIPTTPDVGTAPQPQAAPTPAKIPGVGLGGIQRAMTAQKNAINRTADIQGQESDEKTLAMEHAETLRQAGATAYDARMQALNDQHAALAKKIGVGSIDPNRIWNSTSQGGKVANMLGILLSGIGQGLGGNKSPNMAMEQLDKLSQQDIDAQKANLSKDEGLLADNLKATGNLREAEQMTRAQNLMTMQAQLNRISSKYNNPLVKAQAAQLTGGIDQKLEEVKLTLAQAAQKTATDQAQQKAVADAYANIAQRQGNAYHNMLLSDKEKEMWVNTDSGGALATSPEAKKEYDKSSLSIKAINGHLQRLYALGEQSRGSPNIMQATRQAFEAQRNATILELGKVADLAKFTEPEKLMYETRIRDLNSPTQNYAGFKAGMDGLAAELNEKTKDISNQYLRPLPPGMK